MLKRKNKLLLSCGFSCRVLNKCLFGSDKHQWQTKGWFYIKAAWCTNQFFGATYRIIVSQGQLNHKRAHHRMGMTQKTCILDLTEKGAVSQWTDSLLRSDYIYIIFQTLRKDLMTPVSFNILSFINFTSGLNLEAYLLLGLEVSFAGYGSLKAPNSEILGIQI